ncbi:MAG: hypothetical protein QNJ50_09260 [Mastigocoleus sp. MO_188.B34]|nr:hypothetical protein [Mastigocoleus sp. MO_188.B34]MDJ0694534.1 hypothetical protein [Mastigocoleus sp. MO_188.B34]
MLAKIVCACFAWSIVILSIASVWFSWEKGRKHLRRLHQIPCNRCVFFTNDYRLKCTVNPTQACSEEAINCIDFEVKIKTCNSCHNSPNKSYITFLRKVFPVQYLQKKDIESKYP